MQAAPSRALALALAALAAILAGCVEEPTGIEEGRHLERPPSGTGFITLDLKQVELTWSDGVETRPITLDVRAGNFSAGIFTIETDMLTLRYRIDEPLPVGLAYDENLSRENTFNFTYREPRDLAGRLVTYVTYVDPASRLDVTTWEPAAQDAAGFIDFGFEGACSASEPGCEDPDARHLVRLDGRFPKPRH